MSGLSYLGNLSHDMESLLIKQDAEGLPLDDGFFGAVDEFHESLLSTMDLVKAGPGQAAPAGEPEQQAPVAEVEKAPVQSVKEAPSADVHLPSGAVAAHPEPTKPSASAARRNRLQGEVVRVSAMLLEELVNLAGETSISRGRVEEAVSEFAILFDEMDSTISRLQNQVRRMDIATQAQIGFRREREQEGVEGFDPLEMDRYSQLQQLSRSLVESASDLTDIKRTLQDRSSELETVLIQQQRINSELQEGLMRSRMVPFESVLPRLRRIVRQISGEVDKKVDLRLGNMGAELDRSILERIVAPLEHMLRNAVDHGIESPDRRAAAGKPKAGQVNLDIAREGGDVVITVRDDGAGIDIERVRAKAIERGLITANSDLSEREVLQLIYHAGLSTAESVTQISSWRRYGCGQQ